MIRRGPDSEAALESAVSSCVRAAFPRAVLRRAGALGGSSTDGLEGLSAFATDSSTFGGGVRLRRFIPRRPRGGRAAVFGASAFAVSVDAAGFNSFADGKVSAGDGSGVGAAATSLGGSSMRAPTEDTRLPFLPVANDGASPIAGDCASNNG